MMALGNRNDGGGCTKDRKAWSALVHMYLSFTRAFLLGPVFLRITLPCSGGYHRERGGVLVQYMMQLG